MGNPIPNKMKIGTIGEIFVQLKLLEFEIQAAPPIKDSGNDLIALKERQCKLIQVKTSEGNDIRIRRLPEIYDILALVKLENKKGNISFDSSKIFLLSKDDIDKNKTKTLQFEKLKKYELNQEQLNSLFNK